MYHDYQLNSSLLELPAQDRYVNLEHNYYKIDIVNEPTNLFNIVKAQEGNKVLWTTNVWSSEMLHWNQGPDQLKIKWNKFKSLVPDDLILYGDDYCAIDMRQSIRDNLNISYPEFNQCKSTQLTPVRT